MYGRERKKKKKHRTPSRYPRKEHLPRTHRKIPTERMMGPMQKRQAREDDAEEIERKPAQGPCAYVHASNRMKSVLPFPSTLFVSHILSAGRWVARVMLRCVGVIGSAGRSGGGIDGGSIKIRCLLGHVVVHCGHLSIQTPDLS